MEETRYGPATQDIPSTLLYTYMLFICPLFCPTLKIAVLPSIRLHLTPLANVSRFANIHASDHTLILRFFAIAANDYNNNNNSAPAHHHQAPHGQGDLASPQSTPARYSQNFYPQYPGQPSGPGAGSSSTMPSVHDSMDSMHHQQASTLATPASASMKEAEDDEDNKRALFGNVPDSKRRKFILVEDQQRGTRVRVRVMLDQVKMDDMPDAHLKINSVYPRSYFPRQMRSPPGSPRGRGVWDDEDDDVEGVSGIAPTRGKTMVPVSLMDGSEAKLPVPRMTRTRRAKEVALNELGYRMAWGQARTFNGRTLFLQRSRKSTHFASAFLERCTDNMNSRCVPQQDAQYHGSWRPGRLNHRPAFRNTSWEEEVAGEEQAREKNRVSLISQKPASSCRLDYARRVAWILSEAPHVASSSCRATAVALLALLPLAAEGINDVPLGQFDERFSVTRSERVVCTLLSMQRMTIWSVYGGRCRGVPMADKSIGGPT